MPGRSYSRPKAKHEKEKKKKKGEKSVANKARARRQRCGKKAKRKKLQYPDFARGPPPHYYPGQNVLNFADQTGCGALTIVWP